MISSLKTEGTFTAISFTPKNSLLTSCEKDISVMNRTVKSKHTGGLCNIDAQ